MIEQPAIEINVTRHCTNRCVQCNHGSAYVQSYYMKPETLERDLAGVAPFLHADFICLQGGEPLLHPQIIELLDVCAGSRVSRTVGVLSNGQLVRTMPESFWAKLGQVHGEFRMSCYPNLAEDKIQFAVEKSRQHGFRIRPQIISSFLKIFTDQKDPAGAYRNCPWNRCLTVHEGWFYLCPLSAFFPAQYMNLPANVDGIPIAGLTEQRLAGFLAKADPLQTCSICTGARAERIDWREIHSDKEWMMDAFGHE